MRAARRVKSLSERDEHEAVEQARMKEIHRGDDKADVGGVLALGVGELLVGDKAEGGYLLGPSGKALGRPVAIDAADGCLAQSRDLLEDRFGVAGGNIVGVDQDGEAGRAVFGHGMVLVVRFRSA